LIICKLEKISVLFEKCGLWFWLGWTKIRLDTDRTSYSYDFEKTVENYGEYDSDGWASTTWLMGENQSVAQNGSGYAYKQYKLLLLGKNDWIFSYPIYLKNGETVTVKYHTAIGSEEAEPATLKVAVASAPDKK
jgi:hypothetical protein